MKQNITLAGHRRRDVQPGHLREVGSYRGLAGMGAARKEPEEVQVRQEVDPLRSGERSLHRVLRRRSAAERPELMKHSYALRKKCFFRTNVVAPIKNVFCEKE